MSNGKFSKPRPYRDEEREIEAAFRAITGQAPPPEPQPRAEDYHPPAEELKDYLPEEPEVKEAPFPELDLSDIPDGPEDPGEYEADEPDFLDKVQLYAQKAAAFWKKNPKVIVVSLCALALVLILGFMAAFLFGGSDPYGGKILQNVYIAGVNVGGLSKNEAVTAVKQAAIVYSQQDMVIDLSGTELRLSSAQTKIQLDAKAAVGEAYSYGRSGSRQEQEAAYLASLSQNHYIDLTPYLKADETYIRAALTSCVSGGGTLKQTNYGLEGAQPPLDVDKFDEKAPGQTLVITMGTPGVGFDPEAVFRQVMDAYSLAAFLVEVENVESVTEPEPLDMEAIYEEFYIEPVNASFDVLTNKPTAGSYGYGFDLDKAKELVDKAEYGEELRIPMEYIEPEIFGDNVFFRDVLGAYETRLDSNSARTANLELACEALDGLELNPNEEFSFNRTLGEPTAAKGYKKAPAHSGPDAKNVLGGGVSQAASTLYYCVMEADLAVTARTNHDFVPSFIDRGLDADAGYGGPDFKFRNTSPFPIRIEAKVAGNYVKIQILGTDVRDYYVKVETTTTEKIEPDKVYEDYKWDNDEGYEDGDVIEEGITGYTVKTYRVKYDRETNAQLSKDLEATSRYVTVDRIIARVEEEPTEPPTTEAPEPEPTEEETEQETEEVWESEPEAEPDDDEAWDDGDTDPNDGEE